ncbi:MAG TPA: hypothetical protein PKA27_00620 [Fimbriimonadaceae bacterium]|nr:hypothetical protein [Fimbriimonadaceae bacterium]
MKRLLVALTLLPTLASAQSARIDVIWTAAKNRMYKQSDYWFEDGDFPRCISILKFMAGLEPSNYEIVTDLGWMLENVSKNEEALAVYREYKKNNPKDPDRALPEGNYFYMRREWAKVPPVLEGTLSDKSHENAFRALANSYERLGKFADSKRVWEQMLKFYPNDGQAKVNLKRVLEKMKPSGSE